MNTQWWTSTPRGAVRARPWPPIWKRLNFSWTMISFIAPWYKFHLLLLDGVQSLKLLISLQAKADCISQLKKFRGRSEPTWLFLAVSWTFNLIQIFHGITDHHFWIRAANQLCLSEALTPHSSGKHCSRNYKRRRKCWKEPANGLR